MIGMAGSLVQAHATVICGVAREAGCGGLVSHEQALWLWATVLE